MAEKSKEKTKEKAEEPKKPVKPVDKDYQYIVRIGGTDLNGSKRIPYGLSKIKGIGVRIGEIICGIAGIDRNKQVGYLTEEEANRLDKIVTDFKSQKVPSWLFNRRKDYVTGKDTHVVGAELAISLRDDLNIMKKIRSYKGIRHELGLPVRGQRTRTSFRGGATIGVSKQQIEAAAKAAKAAAAEEEKKKGS